MEVVQATGHRPSIGSNPAPWNFPVELAPVQTAAGVTIPRSRAVVRTDTGEALSVVSDRYRLFTHEQAVETAAPLIRLLGKATETHVTERNGARLISTYTFKDMSVPVQNRKVGDTVAMRLHVVNSYDARSPLEFRIGGMVLRCLNGMTIMGQALEFFFTHTSQIESIQLPSPQLILEMFQSSEGIWGVWGEHEMQAEEFEAITKEAIKFQILSKKQHDKYDDEFSKAVTLWDMHNVYTRVLTHEMTKVQTYRKLGRLDRLNAIIGAAGAGTLLERQQEEEETYA
jgi:hypothetical protein